MNSSKPDPSRAALSNRASRYSVSRVDLDDGVEGPSPVTECRAETAGSIIARNQSPDIPFEQSINPYRGCEHGCIYCYARPTHAWLELSPGLDFETRLSYKQNAAALLEQSFRSPAYRCSAITLGANTDPYQPVEKVHGITRQLLTVMQRFQHPVSIITRGTLVTRDIDILSELAADGLCHVAVSVTTLDRDLKRSMEPRAPSGRARLQAMEQLSRAGVPVALMFAPAIPGLNDREMETILEAAANAGARRAGYILLRLPRETAALFEEWLARHYPLRASHVMSLLQQSRGGHTYDSRFGHRMRGTGPFADLLGKRFRLACRKLGLGDEENRPLRTDRFHIPPAAGQQFSLFP